MEVTVHYRVLFERRVFKNDMASSAIKSYVFIGTSILVFGLLNAKVASVLAKSIFFSLNSTSGGSRSYCTHPIIIISITIIIKKK